jgi:hypothetical protein
MAPTGAIPTLGSRRRSVRLPKTEWQAWSLQGGEMRRERAGAAMAEIGAMGISR